VALAALVLLSLYVALATARPLVRTRRSTGSWQLRVTPGSGRLVEVLFVLANGLVVLAPILDLTGALHRVSAVEGPVAAGVGVTLVAAALPLIVWAQDTMGASWRIGVDPKERTDLVTAGPFRFVRNPIYTGMVMMAVGIALMVPNGVSLAAIAVYLVAVELQVRTVEEPYLLRTHAERFQHYVARSGRFLPGIGRSA
jgi:protein-S-isoprenylcysteine O-methyltransferase Ste14